MARNMKRFLKRIIKDIFSRKAFLVIKGSDIDELIDLELRITQTFGTSQDLKEQGKAFYYSYLRGKAGDFICSLKRNDDAQYELLLTQKSTNPPKVFLKHPLDLFGWFVFPVKPGKKRILNNNATIFIGDLKADDSVSIQFRNQKIWVTTVIWSLYLLLIATLLTIVLVLLFWFTEYNNAPIPAEPAIGSITILNNRGENIRKDNQAYLLKRELNGGQLNLPKDSQLYVSLKDSGNYLRRAIIASEDRRIGTNTTAFDRRRLVVVTLKEMLRVIVKILSFGLINNEQDEGASTIAQQVISASGLMPERYSKNNKDKYDRKFIEIVAAEKLIRRFSLEEILEIYINTIPFGNNIQGVQTASFYYFGKPVSDLSLSETAILVGAIREPSKYDLRKLTSDGTQTAPNSILSSDDSDKKELVKIMSKRRGDILSVIDEVEFKSISKSDLEKANKEPITLSPKLPNRHEEVFLPDYIEIKKELENKLKDENHLTVKLAWDRDFQEKSESTLKYAIENYGNIHGFEQGAIVTLKIKDSSIIALASYPEDFDRARYANRPSGSTFKLFSFLTALEQGRSIDRSYSCSSVDGLSGCERSGSARAISMYDGFVRSENAIAVRVAKEAGYDKVIKMAKSLGLESKTFSSNVNTIIGNDDVTVMDMAAAYAAVINGGNFNKPRSIISLEACKREQERNSCKKLLAENTDSSALVKKMKPETAKNMVDTMRGVVQRADGTGRNAYIEGEDVVGKTGTTDNARDLWFIGALPDKDLLVAVWLGTDKVGTSGSGGVAAQVWRDYVSEVIPK
jgi:penicillin-binding protein 1A